MGYSTHITEQAVERGAYLEQGRLALVRDGDPAAAVRILIAAARRFPRHGIVLGNLGLALQLAGRPRAAAAAYARAVALCPGHAPLLANQAVALSLAGRMEEALAAAERGRAADPADPGAAVSRLSVLLNAGQPAAVVEEADRLLAADPAHPAADQIHTNRGLARLACEDYAGGFADYEHRPGGPARRGAAVAGDLWDGRPLAGGTLVVWGEQGYGDTIQFARFLPAAARRVRRLRLVVRPPLVRLLSVMPGAGEVIGAGDPAAAARRLPADARLPLLSLPQRLGIASRAALGGAPYLATAPPRSDPRAARTPLRVGIAHAGSPTSPIHLLKSLPVAALARLVAAAPGVRFLALEPTTPAQAAALGAAGISPPPPGLEDFADTAAIAASLDLIVTVDTALAHLGGALGRPTWVVLSARGDWRYPGRGVTTPWYDSLRLFRQRRFGSWDAVLERLGTALRARCARHGQRRAAA